MVQEKRILRKIKEIFKRRESLTQENLKKFIGAVKVASTFDSGFL